MKFRRLNLDELKELESDFINFLSANTVTGDDWIKLKEKEPEKANNLIDLFSDIIFEKVLKKVEYLEFKTPQDIKTFHCQADKILMRGLMVEGETALDFTQGMQPIEMIDKLRNSNAQAKMYSAEKQYQNNNREQELFKMMENGCLISKGELFNTLEQLTKGGSV